MCAGPDLLVEWRRTVGCANQATAAARTRGIPLRRLVLLLSSPNTGTGDTLACPGSPLEIANFHSIKFCDIQHGGKLPHSIRSGRFRGFEQPEGVSGCRLGRCGCRGLPCGESIARAREEVAS